MNGINLGKEPAERILVRKYSNSKNKSCLRSGKAGQVDMFACFQNSQTFVKQLHLEIEAHVVQKQKET